MISSTTMIPSPPYVSGPGWQQKVNSWMAEHLPAEIASNVGSEAMISWNRSGGQPSGHWSCVLSRTVEALNAGQEPSFPNIEWNDRYLKEKNAQRDAGICAEDLESIR